MLALLGVGLFFFLVSPFLVVLFILPFRNGDVYSLRVYFEMLIFLEVYK